MRLLLEKRSIRVLIFWVWFLHVIYVHDTTSPLCTTDALSGRLYHVCVNKYVIMKRHERRKRVEPIDGGAGLGLIYCFFRKDIPNFRNLNKTIQRSSIHYFDSYS